MHDNDEAWQQRIKALYENVDELYSHVDVTVVVLDRDLLDVGLPAHASRFGQPLLDIARRVRDTGEPQTDVPLDRVGRQRVHCFPMRDRGTIIGVGCIVTDDEARRELFVRCAMAIFDGYRRHEAELLEREQHAREEAQRANGLRDRFLAVVAHELRTPMASILLCEQVLRDPGLDAGTREWALGAIHDSAAGQSLLVADLLDVSRSINGKLHVDHQPTPLLRILDAVVQDARRRAGELEIVSQIDRGLGQVLGDSRRLRQIFENLISNAINCTKQGRIVVRAQQDEESITIEVSDTGRGIASEALAHLFEPFWQGDRSASADGLGLGLSIARHLVELHRGTLSAASEGLGLGARFTVVLPRVLAPPVADEAAIPSLAGIRVLVVDDDPLLLKALQHLLGRAGAAVSTATSARAAYALLERGEANILVSDIGMPDEDGESLVRRIRATTGMRSLPAIAITARLPELSRDSALAAGFNRYFAKPIDVELLVACIAELVR